MRVNKRIFSDDFFYLTKKENSYHCSSLLLLLLSNDCLFWVILAGNKEPFRVTPSTCE